MDKRLLDDLAQLAGGAMGVLSSLRQQMREEGKSRLDQVAERFDMPTRSELERLSGMVSKARQAQEDILARLAAIESHLGLSGKAKAAAPASAHPKKNAKSARAARPASSPTKKK